MKTLLQTIGNAVFVIGQIGRSVEAKYDRAAPRYERMHQKWLTGQANP